VALQGLPLVRAQNCHQRGAGQTSVHDLNRTTTWHTTIFRRRPAQIKNAKNLPHHSIAESPILEIQSQEVKLCQIDVDFVPWCREWRMPNVHVTCGRERSEVDEIDVD
jgi:hypothetical protein